MGFPTKVQLIQRKDSEQWYINFPSALAQAMEFEKGEEVQWLVSDKAHLILRRQNVPPDSGCGFWGFWSREASELKWVKRLGLIDAFHNS